jgi:hypothetical protein
MTDTLDSYEQVRTRRDHRADRKSDFSIQDIDSAALTKPDRIRLPLVSFIIPNADDKTLDPMLAAISAQDYPRVEAIFITTNSVDTRQEAVRPGNAQFTFLHCAAEDSELARAMAGLQAATGEFITCLGAADLPAAQFASAHIQVHLASCHNVAYTASPRPMIAIEQAVDVDVDGIRSVSESCLRPANASLRLACVDEAMFTRLAAKTSLCPPSPASFSARFNMYRRSVTSLVHPVGEGADLDGLTADAHFGPLCHALGGTAIINMNLMAPARLCDEISKANTCSASGTESNRQKLRVWVSNGPEFARRIGKKRYWAAIAAMIESEPVTNGTEALPATHTDLMEGQIPQLSMAFGSLRTIHQLAEIVPRTALIRLLHQQYGARLPLRVHWALWTGPIRSVHKRVRRHLKKCLARQASPTTPP